MVAGMHVPGAALLGSISGGDAGMRAQLVPEGEMPQYAGIAHGEEMELRHAAVADIRRAIAPTGNAVFAMPRVAQSLDGAALEIERGDIVDQRHQVDDRLGDQP